MSNYSTAARRFSTGWRRERDDVLRGVLLRRVPVFAGAGEVKRALALVRSVPALDAEQRGRLMDAAEVAACVLAGKVSKRWVFENVPTQYRHKLGRVVLFYEGEVRAWLDTLRGQAA